MDRAVADIRSIERGTAGIQRPILLLCWPLSRVCWQYLAISFTPFGLAIATLGVPRPPLRKVCEFGMSGRWGLLVHLTGLVGCRV